MRNAPEVAGERAAKRIMRSLDYRLSPGVEPLTEEQVAVVLHSLADHTALIQAIDYTPRPEGRSYSLYDEAATSVGQWLHDVADDLEDIARDVRP